MTEIELKKKILEGGLENNFMIFQYTDNDFIPNSYIKEIASQRELEAMPASSLKETVQSAFSAVFNALYIIRTDTFSEAGDYQKFKNTIVVCKKVDKKISKSVAPFIITFDKLEEWQIKDYMATVCPGLSKEILDWIYDITSGDIYRIQNELVKCNIFNSEYQPVIFNNLNKDNNYNDLTTQTIYTYINAILNKNYIEIKNILSEGEAVDLEGTGLVTLLIRNIENIIKVQTNKKATPELVGMSQKQFMAVKYQKTVFSLEQLIKIYSFLTSIDFLLKSGKLEMSNRMLVDYITCTVLNGGIV